jgi:hypothetical protein
MIMKKHLFVFACCIVSGAITANAQLQKGDVLVGGDISDFNLTLNSSKAFSATIDPKAAWFIKDNLALGGYVDFQLATAKGEGTTTNYGVGALARYYVSKKDVDVLKSTRLFVEANVGFQGTNAAGGAASTNGLGLGIGPGLAYFISPSVGLEALLKYQNIVGFGSAVSTSDIDLGIGFQIYLSNKKARQILKGQM